MRQKRRQDGGHLACRLRYFPGNVALVARNGKFRRTRLAACNRSKAWPVWLGQAEVGQVEVGQCRTQSGEAFHDKQYLSFGGGAVFLDCDSRGAAMAKYSKEQRRCAVELYVRYECCVADVIRELGYPSREALRMWHRDWLEEQRTGTRRCVEAVRLMLLY